MDKNKKDTQGWLKKQGGVIKAWHRRWFVINGSVLFYFARPDETKSQGSYFLDGHKVVVHSPSADEPDKFVFELCASKLSRHDTESLVLCAASNEERKMWVKALTWALYGGKGGAIFGHSIQDTMKYEHKKFRSVPLIVESSVEYLLKYGLEVEGIFRLPGRSSLIRELKEKYDCAENVSLESLEVDVHTVASVLKLYLRELPESIVPSEFYQKFMNLALNFQEAKEDEEKNEFVVSLQSAMYLLPVDNYNILKYLCSFLKSVCENSDKNKMNQTNIATVFGPNIIRHMDNLPELLLVTADINQQLVFMMIHYFDIVFLLDYCNRSQAVDVPVDDLLGILNDSVKLDSPLKPQNPIWAVTATTDNENDDIFTNGSSNKEIKRKSMTLPVTKPPHSPNSDLKFSDSHFLRSPGSERSATLPRFDENGKPIAPKRKSRIVRGRRVSERRQNRNLSDSDNSCATTPDDLFYQHDPVKALNSSYIADSNEKTSQINNHDMVSTTTSSSSAEMVMFNNATTQTNDEEINGKLQPTVPELHVQITALKEELQRCKNKGDTTIKALKTELTNMKEKYDRRIETMQITHKTQIKTLQEKLEEQTKTADNSLSRVVELQSQLHDYHMHYGELNNNNN